MYSVGLDVSVSRRYIFWNISVLFRSRAKEIVSISFAVWAQCTNVTDRRTNRPQNGGKRCVAIGEIAYRLQRLRSPTVGLVSVSTVIAYFVPSVLWYCWLRLLTCKNRLPYNLYCVGGDVKQYTAQSNPVIAQPRSLPNVYGLVYLPGVPAGGDLSVPYYPAYITACPSAAPKDRRGVYSSEIVPGSFVIFVICESLLSSEITRWLHWTRQRRPANEIYIITRASEQVCTYRPTTQCDLDVYRCPEALTQVQQHNLDSFKWPVHAVQVYLI